MLLKSKILLQIPPPPQTPVVSALMPVFNTNLEYLKENIESILSQTFGDFELLILNDSPENTELEAFILDYAKKDSRIKYFKNPRNLGISPSRNKLIDLANGEFLAVIDHDDVSAKTRFEKQVRFLRENESVGVVGSQALWWRENGDWTTEFPLKDDEIKIALMREHLINHPAAMVRKSLLETSGVRYNAFYTPCEDYKIHCDLIEFTEFANIDEVLHFHRDYGNTSARLAAKMKERHWAIVSENKRKYPELFNVAMIKSRDDVIKPEISTFSYAVRRIRILGVPFFKIIKNNGVFKIKLFSRITIFKVKDEI